MIKVKPTEIESRIRQALKSMGLDKALFLKVDDIYRTFGVSKETINKLVREGKIISCTWSEAPNATQSFLVEDVISYLVKTTIRNQENRNL